MAGRPSRWALAHISSINNKLTDDSDIQKQTRSLCARANVPKCRPSVASLHAKCILFNAYCTSMYGCQLWNSTYEYNFKRLKIAYNDAFRVLLNVSLYLNRRTSAASSLFVSHGIPTFGAVIRKSILYRQHCAQCNAPALKLPRTRF